jgi:ectoine hydroxylase-related dioxygenase (phytanoyl-CoA dioxygenase family)
VPRLADIARRLAGSTFVKGKIMTSSTVDSARTGWLTTQECRLEDFLSIVSERTEPSDYPFADEVVQGVLVYRVAALRRTIEAPEGRREVQAELARALMDGPGLVVFKGAFEDVGVVQRATAVFQDLIAAQQARGVTSGDHFAKPGTNDRVWNALEKLALHDPGTFVEYYSNDILNLISVAWLGPAYQVTSQINVVNPGGKAQTGHRDYHLGFMSADQASLYPAHIHRLTPALTLQGAVAHSDMPVETGPTLYLPHSQKYEPGYLAFHRPEFSEYFEANYVQLPLETGDAAFFNPALFHGAGTNRSSDVKRMANLLQVSSAFGRAMESVDRAAMLGAVFPALRDLRRAGASEHALRNVIAASAEGYAFPTNLDKDQPVDGLAPETQAELAWRALDGDWDDAEFRRELLTHSSRRTTRDD